MPLKEKTMEIKLILYISFTFISALGLSGVNFDGFFKKNKVLEAKVFVITLSFALSYLLTNFVLDFLNL